MDSRISQIDRLLEEGRKFTFQNFCFPNETGQEFGGEDSPGWLAWKTRVLNLARAIGSESSPAFLIAQTACAVHTRGNYANEFERAHTSLVTALEFLHEALDSDAFGEIRQPASTSASPTLSNKVFVVHGHDEALKTETERFLQQFGLEPVVLHRQPDQGQTIIEKFEKHSDVGFAFILLTPDDVAYSIDQQDTPDRDRRTEMRARPNVIFEFRYFVGKLGRHRVCCIYKGNVVLPSDINGLVYKKVEGSLESQGMALIRELKAAGYRIQV